MSDATRPEVRHIYQNHHLDTTRWDCFKPRPGDIVISTSYKAGTTLTQTIVANLLFPHGLPGPVMDLSPWLDMRIGAPLDALLTGLEAQTSRRFIKTHLPLDGIPYFDEIQYIVVGRDPRDVFMSLLNHWGKHTALFYETINGPDRPGPAFPHFDGDIPRIWREWITRGWFDWESDGYPYWSHLHHAKTWWEFRHLPNMRLIHYADLRRDLEGEMRRLADWLNIIVPEDRWPAVVEACRFETVKADPEKVLGARMSDFWEGGGQTFVFKGTNGRWKDVLTSDDLGLYEAAMKKTLAPDCAGWLEDGGAYALDSAPALATS